MTSCQNLSTYFIKKTKQNKPQTWSKPQNKTFCSQRKRDDQSFQDSSSSCGGELFFFRSIFRKTQSLFVLKAIFFSLFSVLPLTMSFPGIKSLVNRHNPVPKKCRYVALLSKSLFTYRLLLIWESLRGNGIIFSMQISILFLSHIFFIFIQGHFAKKKMLSLNFGLLQETV